MLVWVRECWAESEGIGQREPCKSGSCLGAENIVSDMVKCTKPVFFCLCHRGNSSTLRDTLHLTLETGKNSPTMDPALTVLPSLENDLRAEKP